MRVAVVLGTRVGLLMAGKSDGDSPAMALAAIGVARLRWWTLGRPCLASVSHTCKVAGLIPRVRLHGLPSEATNSCRSGPSLLQSKWM